MFAARIFYLIFLQEEKLNTEAHTRDQLDDLKKKFAASSDFHKAIWD